MFLYSANNGRADEVHPKLVPLNFNGVNFVPKHNEIAPLKTNSCVVLNLTNRSGTWLIVKEHWKEKSCISFANKLQAEIYIYYKNEGFPLVIEAKCIRNIGRLSCGWKKT